MTEHDDIFHKIAEALLVDYTSVYYVNAVTNEYQWYSTDPEFHSLHIEPKGEDFFVNLVRDAKKVIHPEDQHIFTSDIQKEKLLAQMKKGTMQNIEYRLMIDGKPVYHTLRMIRGTSEDDDYFILGVKNIDTEVRSRMMAEKIRHEREIYNHIAVSLAEHYDTLYYVNIETNSYFEFSSTDAYKSLNVPPHGDDYFSESAVNIRKYVHPDDVEIALQTHSKEDMLENLRQTNTFTSTYRLIVSGEVIHTRCLIIWANDRQHIIICLENINAEVQTKQSLLESERKTATYSQIAESLAMHYDVIYYVALENGSYVEFTSNAIYGNLEIQEQGVDFFADAQRNVLTFVHPADCERIAKFLEKDYLISALDVKKQFNADYRLVINGEPQFTRMTVMWSSSRQHLIIGVVDITEEMRRENEHLEALNLANELARRDELTGTKNKHAYRELEEGVQQKIDSEMDDIRFAVVVCDLNDLKKTNDTKGHKAGDEYIQDSCRLICQTFAHSPVFRIGGDEFTVFLTGSDFENRQELFAQMRGQVLENLRNGSGPVIAAGISEFCPGSDHRVSEVFERADRMMYEDKKALKAIPRA